MATSAASSRVESHGSWARSFTWLAILVLLELIFRVVESHPVSNVSTDSGFSSERALTVLNRLVGDGAPHPVGTAADNMVRQRIVNELQQMGFQPQVQSAFVCGRFLECAQTNDVLAELTSDQDAPTLMLAAHYDSVGAGPGASDDGSGVAILLEIARILKSNTIPHSNVLFLFDDGEEAGLLGAKAFVEHNSLANIGCVINLEAAGTSGPSLMFETSGNNRELMRVFAKTVPHPVTSSLLYSLYERLPNDTDFTVFKAHGIQGYNFAFIGDASEYHRPLDSVGNISRGSLQHQGESVLALARALAKNGVPKAKGGDAVFFDLFGQTLIWWPASYTPVLIAVAGLLLALATFVLWREKEIDLFILLKSFLCLIAAIGAATVVAILLYLLFFATGALENTWPPHVMPAFIAFTLLALAVTITIVRLTGRASRPLGLLLVNYFCHTAFAAVLTFLLPGGAYLFVVPALAAGVTLVVMAWYGPHKAASQAIAILLPVVVTAILWFRIMHLMYAGFGMPALAVVAILTSWLLLPLFLFTASKPVFRVVLAAAAIAVVAVGAQILMPRYSETHPQRVNVIFHQDADSGSSHWLLQARAGSGLGRFLQSQNFKKQTINDYPGNSQQMMSAEAPQLRISGPTFEVASHEDPGKGQITIDGRLRSRRNATRGLLFFPPGTVLASIRIGGLSVPHLDSTAPETLRQWQSFACTLPAEGMDVSFTVNKSGPDDFYVADESFGLPENATEVLISFPKTAASFANGNVTLLTRRILLRTQ
jgi:hypothetical protein